MTSSAGGQHDALRSGSLAPQLTEPALPDRTAPRRSRVRALARWLLLAVAAGGVFVAGYLPKQRARAALVAEAQRDNQGLPEVATIQAKPLAAAKPFSLPGNLKGFEQTVLFARANGYVSRWLADMGDQVEEGQLLAELDTPELDREVEQAQAGVAESVAALTEAKAGRDFARVNLERFQALVPAGVATQGELQKAEAEAHVSDAKVGVAQAVRSSRLANLHRLEQLKSFARVTAPFSGVVTSRKVDRGTLVSAGSSALFELAMVEPLRVIIDVPQSLALGVQAGATGSLRVRELPGQSFTAKVERTSGTLESSSRTLRVELSVPNPGRRLLPGMYAEVAIALERTRSILVLPASAVISTKEGLRVATVDEANVVRMKPVVLERDNGSEVEIASGISPSDRIVASPRPFLSDGDRVRVAAGKP